METVKIISQEVSGSIFNDLQRLLTRISRSRNEIELHERKGDAPFVVYLSLRPLVILAINTLMTEMD